MKVLYFDCFSGAAGDMLLAALIDAGAPYEKVATDLKCLGLSGWDLRISSTRSGGMRATRTEVHQTSSQMPRTYKELHAAVADAPLSSGIKDKALKTFRLLAEAEAHVHEVDVNEVRFHEVGAIDTIIDIVGCASALESLAPDRILTSEIATGTGTIETSHGTVPLPAPAVVEILGRTDAILVPHGSHELITPTGAALLAAVTNEFGSFPAMRVESWGYGAGSQQFQTPNVVRVLIGESLEPERPDEDVVLIEANIDDMTPELLAHAVERLLEAKAHDAWVTPIVMKKGRPAFKLSALTAETDEQRVVETFFRETTTLGLRVAPAARRTLEREWIETTVEGLLVRVKVGRYEGLVTTLSPEYEDAVAVARATDLPVKEVYARALKAAEAKAGT